VNILNLIMWIHIVDSGNIWWAIGIQWEKRPVESSNSVTGVLENSTTIL